MISDKVIYTDGRDVTVTDSILKVKNMEYRINGITKLGFWTIRANRWPGVLLVCLGLVLMACGWLNMLPATMNMETDRGIININALALWTGAALMVIGLLVTVLVRERYAVRIATAEGEKNVIVSHKREYISQIVDALNSAFGFGSTRPVFGPPTHTSTT
jgi:hypothetical protein